MNEPQRATPDASPRVAMLFTHRSSELVIASALREAGITVHVLSNPLGLIEAVQLHRVDVALIQDQGLHFVDCLTAMRFHGASSVPLMAVGQGSSEEIARCLRQGASDYALLGEGIAALVNRVRARIEVARETEVVATSLQVHSCRLDEASHSLEWQTGRAQLTSREFALAWVLFTHVGQVVNLRTLSLQVWGRDASMAKRTIEQHVSRLRAKLDAACVGASERLRLYAVHNVGYRLVTEPG